MCCLWFTKHPLLGTAIFFFLLSFVFSDFGKRQDFEIPGGPGYSVGDFLILGDILIVANSYHTNANLFVIDISGSEMSVITSTTICTTSPFYFNRFLYINETYFYYECQYIDVEFVIHNQVGIAYWTGKSIEFVPGIGTLYPGSLFPITIPPNSKMVWFYGEDTKDPSIWGLNAQANWNNITSELDIPESYGYEAEQAGFISSQGDYLICSSGTQGVDRTAPIWKMSIPEGNNLGNLTNPAGPKSAPSYTFTDYSTGKSVAFIIDNSDHLSAYLVQMDFDQMQPSSQPLLLSYPHWTIYAGTPPWDEASFSNGYFFITVSVDTQGILCCPQWIQQIQLVDDPAYTPILIDTATYYYEYSHNLIATTDWIYTDTSQSTISRWQIK